MTNFNRKQHSLKTDPIPFDETMKGRKLWEIRKNDRAFCEGDTVTLHETASSAAEMSAGAALEYTGRHWHGMITWILHGPQYGLAEGWCIFGVAPGFADTAEDIEARLQYDLENSCPHCGGSGHKDDVVDAPASGEVDLDEDYPNFCIVSFGHKGYELKHEVFTDVESAAIRANELESKGFGIVLRQSAYTNPPAKVPEAAEYFDSVISPIILAYALHSDELIVRRIWDDVRRSVMSSTPTPATTPETEWVKCADRLPEKGVVVLVNVDYDHHSIKPSVLTAHWTGSTFKIGPNSVNFNCDAPAVTHWRELPAPPQEQ